MAAGAIQSFTRKITAPDFKTPSSTEEVGELLAEGLELLGVSFKLRVVNEAELLISLRPGRREYAAVYNLTYAMSSCAIDPLGGIEDSVSKRRKWLRFAIYVCRVSFHFRRDRQVE